MKSARENCKIQNDKREAMALIITKMSEEGMWDSLKAKDVPEEIVQHVMAELDAGRSASEVRKGMGIRGAASKEWGKIVAALKMGYRINAPTYFHHLFTKQERMAGKLEKIINTVLDQDVEALKDVDPDTGIPLMRTWSKEMTSLIDSYNKLIQSTVKHGKDLGVFAETGEAAKNTGTTIILKSHITLTPPKAEPKTIEGKVVSKESLPKP